MIFLPEECQNSHLYRVSAVRIGGLWPDGGKISSVSTTEQKKTGPNRETTTTRSIAVAIIAALGGLLFGYDTGVISGALLYIQRSFELTPGQESTVTAMLLVGAAIGAFLGGRVADSLGRRGTILLGAVGFIIGSIWCAFATSAFSLGAARTLLGVCIGGVSIVVPMYISEMAPPHVRGRLVSLNSLMIVIGQLVAFLTNSALASSGNWRLMLGLGAVPGIVLLIGMLVLPDTPAYLVRRGQEGKALAVLRQMQGSQATLAEVAVGEASSSADQRAAERLALKTPWVRRTVIIAMLIGVTQQVTGLCRDDLGNQEPGRHRHSRLLKHDKYSHQQKRHHGPRRRVTRQTIDGRQHEQRARTAHQTDNQHSPTTNAVNDAHTNCTRNHRGDTDDDGGIDRAFRRQANLVHHRRREIHNRVRARDLLCHTNKHRNDDRASHPRGFEGQTLSCTLIGARRRLTNGNLSQGRLISLHPPENGQRLALLPPTDEVSRRVRQNQHADEQHDAGDGTEAKHESPVTGGG